MCVTPTLSLSELGPTGRLRGTAVLGLGPHPERVSPAVQQSKLAGWRAELGLGEAKVVPAGGWLWSRGRGGGGWVAGLVTGRGWGEVSRCLEARVKPTPMAEQHSLPVKKGTEKARLGDPSRHWAEAGASRQPGGDPKCPATRREQLGGRRVIKDNHGDPSFAHFFFFPSQVM